MVKVLVTGATGEVGRGTVPFLERDFDLRLLALDAPAADARWIRADIRDWHALVSAMQGVDAVLHLAVATGHSGPYEDDAFNDLRFDVNVKGTFHVFEAARRAGVRRVVHVSSVMVTWGQAQRTVQQKGHHLVPGDAAAEPVGTYALTKCLAEAIARHYAGGTEVITLRIAAPLDLAAPDLHERKIRPQQVPLPDLAQAFSLALRVPLHGYQIVTIAGLSARCLWDLEPARRVLGYRPQINLDTLGIPLSEPFDVAPV